MQAVADNKYINRCFYKIYFMNTQSHLKKEIIKHKKENFSDWNVGRCLQNRYWTTYDQSKVTFGTTQAYSQHLMQAEADNKYLNICFLQNIFYECPNSFEKKEIIKLKKENNLE